MRGDRGEQRQVVLHRGVGALLVLAESSREDGGSLQLAPLSVAVRSALDLLNLGRFLSIHASEAEARAAVGAREAA